MSKLRRRDYLDEMGPQAKEPTISLPDSTNKKLAQAVKTGNARFIQTVARNLRMKYGQSYGQIFSLVKRAAPGIEMRDFEGFMQESRMDEGGYGMTHDQKYIGRLDPEQEALFDEIVLMAENDGDAYRKKDAKMAFERAKREYTQIAAQNMRENFRAISKPVEQYLKDRWAREKREMDW